MRVCCMLWLPLYACMWIYMEYLYVLMTPDDNMIGSIKWWWAMLCVFFFLFWANCLQFCLCKPLPLLHSLSLYLAFYLIYSVFLACVCADDLILILHSRVRDDVYLFLSVSFLLLLIFQHCRIKKMNIIAFHALCFCCFAAFLSPNSFSLFLACSTDHQCE